MTIYHFSVYNDDNHNHNIYALLCVVGESHGPFGITELRHLNSHPHTNHGLCGIDYSYAALIYVQSEY